MKEELRSPKPGRISATFKMVFKLELGSFRQGTQIEFRWLFENLGWQAKEEGTPEGSE